MKINSHGHFYGILFICITLVLALTGCDQEPQHFYTYQQPVKMNDGIEVGSLSEVNLDVNRIETAWDDIIAGEYGEVHSMLIYQDGKLVFEEYFPGHDYQWDGPDFHGNWVDWNARRRHNIHSVGKSITSACIGIAIEKGFIGSVDQSIFDYLPEYIDLNTGGKNEITIEHLLTMTSGLQWDEWGTSYGDSSNDVIALWLDCDDPIRCILEKPLVSEPGIRFTYSGGNIIVLGEIIRNASGMDIESFSWQYLFDPLGIESPPWRWIEGTGVVYAGGDQQLTPREMLKFGITYLDNGIWNGKQIIPENWVEKSAQYYSGADNHWLNSAIKSIPPGDSTYGSRGYSYTWWTHEFSHNGRKIPAYWAYGWGGQKIAVLPNQNTVVVFTGGNYTSADATARVLEKYVIPAFE